MKQALERSVKEVPHKEAIVLGTQRVTYRELHEASNKVANALLRLGMKKGDHVAMLLCHNPGWVINYFGVTKAGGVPVLFSTALKAPEITPFLRDSDSTILITEQKFSQMVSSVLPHVPTLRRVIEVDTDCYINMVADSSSVSPDVDLRDTDEAVIFYTCGVLGKYKGVVHTHNSVMGTPPILSAKIQRRRADVIIDLVPFFYLFGLFEVLFGSIITGSTVVLIGSFTPETVLEAVEKEKGSIIFGVPAMYNALAMVPEEILRGYDLSSLRLAVSAGAKSTLELMAMLENKFGLDFYEAYGLTETSGVSMSSFSSRKLGTVGKPICGIKILDDRGAEVPRGEIGEAVFKVPWVMKGYYKAPELTAQVLKDGWFHTGDLVRMDEEGYVEYIQKKSPIIVTASGLKINPREVESVLLSHPSVAEAAYIAVNGNYGGQVRIAFVVLKEGQHATAEELSELCYQNLADFKLPKRIEFVESIPKTDSGEIDRNKLKESQARICLRSTS
ncbi:MAG: class I adenylate-forming enzyme family protein [Dehalococcoidia bacterium]